MVGEIRDHDYATLAGFRHQLRCFLRFSQEAAAGVGLKPQQHQALLSIRGSPDARMSISALADHLLLKRHSVSELVDRLEALELVRRTADQKDGRVVTVSLTPRADRLLVSISAAHRAELQRIRPLLTGLLDSL